MHDWMGFQCETFRFTLKVTSLLIMPAYKGAVFRGALGNALRRVVCAIPHGSCESCLLREKCLYIKIFEPEPPPGHPDAAKFTSAPTPFVLNPPHTGKKIFHPTDTLEFELVLIGRFIETLPYLIFTFTEIGRRGLGPQRGCYEIERVELCTDDGNETVFNGSSDPTITFRHSGQPKIKRFAESIEFVTLKLQTPLRLKQIGKLVTSLDFEFLFESLIRRVTLLSALYGSNGPPPDLSAIRAKAKEIQAVRNNTYWYDWSRYSQRQKSMMKFGGLLGEISFQGELGPFLPWLKLGEKINVGKGTSFGLGKYWIDL